MAEVTEKTNTSLLDSEMQYKIRSLYLEGKSVIQIQSILGIKDGTWDNYVYLNKQGFRDFYMAIRKEKMLIDAERVSSEILNMKLQGENAKILAIKQKEAEFIRETQGKDLGYSKRIETIGLNINKNEPLDDEQKAKLDNLIKSSSNTPDIEK
jgi:hypothetical protein